MDIQKVPTFIFKGPKNIKASIISDNEIMEFLSSGEKLFLNSWSSRYFNEFHELSYKLFEINRCSPFIQTKYISSEPNSLLDFVGIARYSISLMRDSMITDFDAFGRNFIFGLERERGAISFAKEKDEDLLQTIVRHKPSDFIRLEPYIFTFYDRKGEAIQSHDYTSRDYEKLTN